LSKENIAIVLGGGITGLGVIRNLSIAGVEVHCLLEDNDFAEFSKYCKKKYFVADSAVNSEKLKQFLNNLQLPCRKAVLFPVTDLYTLSLSRIKDQLKDLYCPIVADKKVIEGIVLKHNFYKTLQPYDMTYPSTNCPKTIEEAKNLSQKIPYPIFIKPSESSNFQQTFNTKGFVANNQQELINYYSLTQKHNIRVIFQEIIPGSADRMYSIAGFFDKTHKAKALFAYHRLRGWPTDFGVSSSIESIPIERLSLVKDKLVHYLSQTQYYGIMEAEFKFDSRDNQFKLIEINARSWWQNTLPTFCGLNMIYLAYLDAIGKNVKFRHDYTQGLTWTNFLLDFQSVKKSKGSVSKWIKSAAKTNVWSVFSPTDPIPWVASNLETLRSIAKGKFSHNNIDI
jgi:D-aspartate ligase